MRRTGAHYASLKDSIRGRLREALPPGARTVALFGAAETGEVTLAALKDMDLRVTAIVDNDPGKQGQACHGHDAGCVEESWRPKGEALCNPFPRRTAS